ncbi:MAG: leucine-rich repeat domain-containing protein [Clostridia bacterium]|nr:leucine-rich repeat domain-containing protein [Clostridia bacterium]
MPDNIVDQLIELGLISQDDINHYIENAKTKSTPLIKQEISTLNGLEHNSPINKKGATYSTIIDGILIQFDERDLVDGKYITPPDVTVIGKGAFKGCKNLNEVVISKGVTTIEDSAFAFCSNLQAIIIPNTVTQIGSATFFGCTSLTSIAIPSKVVELPQFLFMGCTSLHEIKLPKKLFSVALSAFWLCDNITDINLPDPFQKSWNSGLYKCPNSLQQEIFNKI